MNGFARIAALLIGLGGAGASAQGVTPFLPSKSAPKIVKLLAPSDFIERSAIEAFEKQGGATVALDGYSNAIELAQRNAEQTYDVMVLRGPALARAIADGRLARLDFARLPNARRVQPAVAAKYAAYDRAGAYGAPFGWAAFGLIYDADKWADAPTGSPVSWVQALGAAKERRPCDIVWPDARDESFFAAWRMLGVDPAHARVADVKSAAAVLERARGAALVFGAPDEVGAFAKGAACLGAGTAGEAVAAVARGGDSAPQVRFAYPREGAVVTLYAFVIPTTAPAPEAAYRLIDALLAPEAARRNAALAGVNGAQEPTDLDILKRLAPEPTLDPALSGAMQSEWKRLTSAK